MSAEENPTPVETREDIPLRPNESSGFGQHFGGIRLIIASFAALSIAVTIALATQIYYGDFEIVPHGSVATDSKECSEIGTNILKSGGNAVDAAIAATFCLSIVNPHTTGLDADGAIMLYDYRRSRSIDIIPAPPIVVDFSESVRFGNIPQLIKGLAFVHEKFGRLSWDALIQPSIDLASSGWSVPSSLVAAVQSVGAQELFPSLEPGRIISAPSLAKYLKIIANTSVPELFPHADQSGIFTSVALSFDIGDFTIYTPSETVSTILERILKSTFKLNQSMETYNSPEMVSRRALNLKTYLKSTFSFGPASSVAVIDKNDFYVSLISGMHVLLGSQKLSPDGYIVNEPPPIPLSQANTFVPLILTQQYVCGQRVVLSCGEVVGASQVIGNLIVGDHLTSSSFASALESPRVRILSVPNIAFEKSHTPKFSPSVLESLRGLGPLTIAPEPYPTCNAVQQIGDALSSHSDSRGGGIASRF